MIKNIDKKRVRPLWLSRLGFTLTEILIVLAILAIVASIAVPSIITFIEYGKQTNRANIARTLYLAMQNELTTMDIEKNLKSTLTGDYYTKNANGEYAGIDDSKKSTRNVASALGTNYPSDDAGNEDYVHYISKPAGYTPTGTNKELDAFYAILDKAIVDTSILDGAILMEYNIETGLVMSIFYSDTLDDGEEFTYSSDSSETFSDDNIYGARGMEDGGYQYDKKRHQGYYGARTTGEPMPIALDDVVTIYDGVDKPLYGNQNVLYAELLVSADSMPDYTLELVSASGAEKTYLKLECTGASLSAMAEMSFEESLIFASGGQYIYRDSAIADFELNGVNIGALYDRYIWVIDYIGGDLTQTQTYSIAGKTNDGITSVIGSTVKAKATRDNGTSTTSATTANTHYYRLQSNKYIIKSARHLNNIRYMPSGVYVQTNDIDMLLEDNEITNFAPIEQFGGKYSAMKDTSTQHKILNLAMNSQAANVGLFAEISGSVTGVSLYNAQIKSSSSASVNIGAIAGSVAAGGTILQCNSYANVTSASAVSAASNVGGLAGSNAGTIDSCFTAGFYDASVKTATADGVGSVTVYSGNGGGIAGLNSGTIKNSFNNARVNVTNVTYTPAEGSATGGLSHDPAYTTPTGAVALGGIAGRNSGTISNNYATNYVAIGTNSGGIVGNSTGTVNNNSYIANGCPDDGAGSKETLSNNKYTVTVDNKYTAYPYKTISKNNPFADADTEWGWEDIAAFELGKIELLYYEVYGDGSYGYSAGGVTPLANSADGKFVKNDGYVLEFEYTDDMSFTLSINGKDYTLTSRKNNNNVTWTWSSGNPSPKLSNIPEAYEGTRYRLFLENSVLESYANGANLIKFEIKQASNPTAFLAWFNPLFADTVTKTEPAATPNYQVRSPRHLDNVDKAPSASFTQGMNLDFGIYLKKCTVTKSGNTTSIAFSDPLTFDKVAVVTGEFKGTYNGSGLYAKNVSAKYGIFYKLGSDATIDGFNLRSSTITAVESSTPTGAGGIVIENLGNILNCTIDTVTVVATSNQYFGGIAGNSSGTIENCTAKSLTIKANGNSSYIGGIAGNSTGTITGCTVEGAKVSGGFAGTAGGIAGSSSNTIENCISKSWTVKAAGGSKYIGGIAGKSTAAIIGCTVEGADVSGETYVGGIAGDSTAKIETCLVTLASNIAGANGGSVRIGGIAGGNSGTVSCSAVSYSTVNSEGAAGGIVGTNESTGIVRDVFFLSIQSTTPITGKSNGKVGGIVADNSGTVEYALFLAPTPIYETPHFELRPIVGSGNLSAKTSDNVDTCIYLQGSRYSLDEGSTWIDEPYNRTSLIVLNPTDYRKVEFAGGGTGMVTKFIELNWLDFGYKVSFDNWYQPTNGYPYPVPNGLEVPELWTAADAPARPDQTGRTDWATVSSTSNRALNLDFINGEFDASLLDPVSGAYISMTANGKWNTSTDGYVRRGGDSISSWIYYTQEWVQGWSTRMVNPANNGKIESDVIEFQGPGGAGIRTDYTGGSTGIFAELNAQYPSTLYQICSTLPGSELYYSFYHAVKDSSNINTLNFYLSGMTLNGSDWEYTGGSQSIIRPCSTSSRDNIKKTMSYGQVSFYDPDLKNTRTAYLYDVWIGDYGFTFWSSSNISIGNNSNQIPTNGITMNQYNNNSKAWLASAKTNIIGYWDVQTFGSYNSDWKQFYGQYTIPSGQVTTEFAYESIVGSGSNETGNFLDGITFKSPAFLSIDQNIKLDGEDVKFVKPGDILTVELNIKNWGEVAGDTIVIKNQFYPYNEYIDFITGSARVNGVTLNSGNITNPAVSNKQTLTISLPSSTSLNTNETMKVTYQIKVRDEVKTTPGVYTLLYYFKNQATISYCQDAYRNSNTFDAYKNTVKTNASEVLQVFIDPIKLSKTVTPSTNGPFTVTLKVESTLDSSSNPINTTGLITDLVAPGFTVSNLPAGATAISSPDGSTRILIRNANLDSVNTELEYTYTLRYTDSGYGVAYTSTSADYKYLYSDGTLSETVSVMLEFPQTLVGISIDTYDDEYSMGAFTTKVFNITANDDYTKRLADGNYNVTPEIVLLSGGSLAGKNANGDYQITNDDYTAVIIRSTGELQFTTKNTAGSFDIQYQIRLTATKEGSASFYLDSRVTTVTVNVVADTLVYYEKYSNGSYGFYGIGGNLPYYLPGLTNMDTQILESGYAVISAASGKTVTASIPGADGDNILATTGTDISYNSLYMYKIHIVDESMEMDPGSPPDYIMNFPLQDVKVDGNPIGRIYPNFAKMVYAAGYSTEPDTFYVRTPSQLNNYILVDAGYKDGDPPDKSFVFELGLEAPAEVTQSPEPSEDLSTDLQDEQTVGAPQAAASVLRGRLV